MKHKKILAVLGLLIVLTALCIAYTADYYRADEIAAAAMASHSGISVEQRDNVVAFIPEKAETGFIFYPGGKVEHTAYAPLMRSLAEHDILCALVEMPLNLAVLDMNAAGDIPGQYPQIDRWYIGGHSLGGSMAASHAASNADRYEGLVLLASYSTSDLTDSGLRVISLYGSADGVLNMEKYADNKRRLPASFEEHVISGGCHAGFGSYGPQTGDGVPTISAQAQMDETVRLLTAFFAAQ